MRITPRIIEPQPKQVEFLSSSADITIYGGAAGSGKTFSLLLEPLRHVNNPKFNAVIFRRTFPQIRAPGGLWSESFNLYSLIKAIPKESTLEWDFPSGAKVKFSHMEHDKNRFDWQGAQVPLICFDELTQFTKDQFFYLLSRNRSDSGIPGYIRATCNPDADSWVSEFIEWWINQDTGFPIPERSGIKRYFIRENDKIIWSDSPHEFKCKESQPKSVTFINANINDNQILMLKDPSYLSNLKALPYVDRMQLLDGNWKIRPAAGLYFKREYFEIIDVVPASLHFIRMWDRAATEKTDDNDPDWTSGLKVGRDDNGIFYITDLVHMRESAFKVEQSIQNMVSQDGKSTTIGIYQDPGSAGKGEADYMIRLLAGYPIYSNKITQNKIMAARPASAQAERGNIKLLRGKWNNDFLEELESFPEGKHDDIVDTLSGAIDFFCSKQVGSFKKISQDDKKVIPSSRFLEKRFKTQF